MTYSLKMHDTYFYEIRRLAWGEACVHSTSYKYEDALEEAVRLAKVGIETAIVGKKSQEFLYTSPEEIREELSKRRLTINIDDMEYAASGASGSNYAAQIAKLMEEHKIASFTLDLEDRKVVEFVPFAEESSIVD